MTSLTSTHSKQSSYHGSMRSNTPVPSNLSRVLADDIETCSLGYSDSSWTMPSKLQDNNTKENTKTHDVLRQCMKTIEKQQRTIDNLQKQVNSLTEKERPDKRDIESWVQRYCSKYMSSLQTHLTELQSDVLQKASIQYVDNTMKSRASKSDLMLLTKANSPKMTSSDSYLALESKNSLQSDIQDLRHHCDHTLSTVTSLENKFNFRFSSIQSELEEIGKQLHKFPSYLNLKTTLDHLTSDHDSYSTIKNDQILLTERIKRVEKACYDQSKNIETVRQQSSVTSSSPSSKHPVATVESVERITERIQKIEKLLQQQTEQMTVSQRQWKSITESRKASKEECDSKLEEISNRLVTFMEDHSKVHHKIEDRISSQLAESCTNLLSLIEASSGKVDSLTGSCKDQLKQVQREIRSIKERESSIGNDMDEINLKFAAIEQLVLLQGEEVTSGVHEIKKLCRKVKLDDKYNQMRQEVTS